MGFHEYFELYVCETSTCITRVFYVTSTLRVSLSIFTVWLYNGVAFGG